MSRRECFPKRSKDLAQATAKGANTDQIAEMRSVYEQSGWIGYWQATLAQLERSDTKNLVEGAMIRARIYTRLGKNDQAFALLNQACDGRSNWVVWLKVDPLCDRLHADPRWPELMRRLGLA